MPETKVLNEGMVYLVGRGDRMGLHGDFWTRFLLFLLRVFPVWFCVLMAQPIATVFYAFAARPRKAVVGNLRALRPELKGLGLWWAGQRVFAQFALTYMDRLWNLYLGHTLEWDFKDREGIERHLATSKGVLLFTVHSGNYDIGASLFAQRFPRCVHVVRVPEKTEQLQQLRAAELENVTHQSSKLRIHYSNNEWNLGLELCGLLRSGAAVAVQGDRLVSSSPPVLLDHGGLTFRLPRGPLVLAEISGVPCYPIFLSRQGRCRYLIQSGAPFYDGASKRRAEEIGRAWLPVMAQFVRQNWAQWFVFENIVTRADAGSNRVARSIAVRCNSADVCE